jgi:hypothetical protein
MWILSFLPDWIFHLVVIVGILGLLTSTFFGFLPFIGKYALPVKVASILLLVVGVWFEGAISNNNSWLEKVRALEKKIAEAEIKSSQANVKLTSVIAEKNREVAKVQSELKNRVKQISSTIDAECKISPEVITVLNDAAIPGPKGGKRK